MAELSCCTDFIYPIYNFVLTAQIADNEAILKDAFLVMYDSPKFISMIDLRQCNASWLSPRSVITIVRFLQEMRERTIKQVVATAIILPDTLIKIMFANLLRLYRNERPVKFVNNENEAMDFILGLNITHDIVLSKTTANSEDLNMIDTSSLSKDMLPNMSDVDNVQNELDNIKRLQ
jgi:hypothetical protein